MPDLKQLLKDIDRVIAFCDQGAVENAIELLSVICKNILTRRPYNAQWTWSRGLATNMGDPQCLTKC